MSAGHMLHARTHCRFLGKARWARYWRNRHILSLVVDSVTR
jgi:hypothetical protein